MLRVATTENIKFEYHSQKPSDQIKSPSTPVGTQALASNPRSVPISINQPIDPSCIPPYKSETECVQCCTVSAPEELCQKQCNLESGETQYSQSPVSAPAPAPSPGGAAQNTESPVVTPIPVPTHEEEALITRRPTQSNTEHSNNPTRVSDTPSVEPSPVAINTTGEPSVIVITDTPSLASSREPSTIAAPTGIPSHAVDTAHSTLAPQTVQPSGQPSASQTQNDQNAAPTGTPSSREKNTVKPSGVQDTTNPTIVETTTVSPTTRATTFAPTVLLGALINATSGSEDSSEADSYKDKVIVVAICLMLLSLAALAAYKYGGKSDATADEKPSDVPKGKALVPTEETII